jgi:hypothetical protein
MGKRPIAAVLTLVAGDNAIADDQVPGSGTAVHVRLGCGTFQRLVFPSGIPRVRTIVRPVRP